MNALIWLTGIFILLAYILYKFSRRNDQYWQKRGFTIVAADPSWKMILGKILPWSSDQKIYNRAKEFNEKLVGFLLFTNPEITIVDLDLAKQVFIKDFDYFMDRRSFSLEKTDPIFHKMLFFMESEDWKELRTKLTPTFTTGKIKRMQHIFETSSNKLIQHLEKERRTNASSNVDFIDGFQKYALDVIASAAFGLDEKLFDGDSDFQKIGKNLNIKITPRIMILFIIMTLAPKLLSFFPEGSGFMDKKTSDYFTTVIKQAIYHRKQSGEVRDDFLQIILEAQKELHVQEGSNPLTDDVIVAQSVLFIFAGFETTNTLLLFSMYELALNPEIQDRLYEDLKKLMDENNGKFTYEGINSLDYLDKVVNETLRMYPPAPGLERKTMRDYTVPLPGPKLIIPKDTMVRIPTYAIHWDPEHFPNPSKFDPERFSPEIKAKRHPLAWMPFGHGPRNCIGNRFALFNAKRSIASVVMNYVIEPCEKTVIPMKLIANFGGMKPKNGMWLKITPRPDVKP